MANQHTVESTVTRLLLSLEQFLGALTQWSDRHMDAEGVSNVCVWVGKDFNAAVRAFEVHGISMQELLSIPGDLRTALERCLAGDITPEHLNLHMPPLLQIIANLMQGLRAKQSLYSGRRMEHRNSTSPQIQSTQ